MTISLAHLSRDDDADVRPQNRPAGGRGWQSQIPGRTGRRLDGAALISVARVGLTLRAGNPDRPRKSPHDKNKGVAATTILAHPFGVSGGHALEAFHVR